MNKIAEEMAKTLLELQKYIGSQFPHYLKFNWNIDMCLKAYEHEISKIKEE